VDLLEAASGIKVLVTSRERIGTRSEHLLPLGGLAYMVDERREIDEESPEHEAALLFLISAQRVLPGFTATASVKRHVDRICRLVQGLPLALELAAKWVNSMSLTDIYAEIERSLSFLQAEAPDLPQRHRSMAAVFESSWKALSSTQQTVLAGLAVFQGGFTLDAAKQVANASSGTLSLLVGRSLLRFDHSDSRYHIHELLRQYAAARLADNPELAREVRHCHLAYYCQLAKQGEEHLHGGDQIGWTHRLLQETGNIRTAIEWGIDHDLAVAARLASHLYLFWFSTGQSREGQQQYERLLARKAELPANLRAWVHFGYTSVMWMAGKLDVIKASSEEALQLFQATEDAAGLEQAYFNLAYLDYLRADLQSALHNIDLAIQHARLVPTDTWYLSHGFMGKATFLHAFGQHDAVKQIAAEDILRCQARGDRSLAITHWARLANIALIEGDLEEAKSLSRQVLAFAQNVKDRRFEALEYLNLGQIALAEGDPRAALGYFEDGVVIGTDGYGLDVLIEIWLRLGDTQLELNQPGLALNAFRHSASLCLKLHWFDNAAADCLERLAYFRWQQKPLSLDAVRWLAAAASWREKANVLLTSPDRARVDRLSEEIRAHVPENDLARARQEGASQSLEEALSSAMLNAGGAPWLS
jgi:predicted ATPase